MSVEVRPVRGPQELAAVYRVRHIVFVDEQKVPVEEELDAKDATAIHFIALAGREAVGAARLLAPEYPGGAAHLGRLAVLADYRGRGVGAMLVDGVHREALARFGQAGRVRVELSAQVSAAGFYTRLGYRVHGPVYLDAGIDHRDAWIEIGPDSTVGGEP